MLKKRPNWGTKSRKIKKGDKEMVKKISTLALAAMIALPSMASAGGADDISAQIERLTQELNKLKQEMAQLKETNAETMETIDEKSEKWDLASRIQISGDMRSMITGVKAESTTHWDGLRLGNGIADFMTVGNVMNRYSTLNSGGVSVFDGGATMRVQDFAMAYASTSVAEFQTNVLDGSAIGQTDLPITANEAAAMQRVFGNNSNGLGAGGMATMNPTILGVLNPTFMGAALSAMSPSFTNLENLVSFMKGNVPGAPMTALTRYNIFTEMGYATKAATDYENDTLWTNRFRLNLRAKATENMEFKARLSMYKAWGMQNNPVDYTANAGMGGGPYLLNSLSFDGSSSRQPTDNKLVVDRAFMNWNNIADRNIWFSIGRRPTTDGPPAQLRMGADQKMATPVNYMDYPFDGATIGYAYDTLFGLEDFPGRVRFCYGRGFESGPTENGDGIKDVDFAGINWDVYHSGDRFFNIQSFAAFDMFNVPDNINFVNPVEYYVWQIDPTQYDPTDSTKNLMLDRVNLGNIYHTSAVYMNKVQDLNYFLVGGWSQTKAEGIDELGTSLLGSFFDEPEDKDGYAFYAGIRYDFPDKPFKVGLEYNYGTKNWISFTPGNDDLYASKLATRGHVLEAYTIWDIPAGEAVSKFGRAFVRLGYQHYEYDYTGSGFWLGEPLDIDELAADPLSAQFYTPIDSQDQIYLSLEAWF